MRSLRITVAVAAIACVVGALASPAFASKEKPKAFYGEFFANVPTGGPITPSTPVIAKTKEGELGALYMGSEEKGPFSFHCASLSSQAKVTAEQSETFLTEIKFHKCTVERRLHGNLVEVIKGSFQKGFEMEFHSNGAALVGKSEGEAKIVKGTSIEVKVRGGSCKIIIPEQTIPTKDEKNPEGEFESAEYGTTHEASEKLKVFPKAFQDKLEVAWELSHFMFDIPVTPTGPCQYTKEPGGKFNEETHEVEFPGYFEGELEEIAVKKGEIKFENAAEIKEREEKAEEVWSR